MSLLSNTNIGLDWAFSIAPSPINAKNAQFEYLAGETLTRRELKTSWPREADAYPVLVAVWNNLFEPEFMRADVLRATVLVLKGATNDPAETMRRLEEAIDAT